MKPFTRDINIDLIKKGTLLRSKISNRFFIVIGVKETWLHSHKYFKCMCVRADFGGLGYVFPRLFKEIDYVDLWKDELIDLEEVVL